MTTPILIDCDPGHDDAIAILLALASPEVEVVGITTVAGNAPLEHTTPNALRILELAERADIPVAAGADRPLLRPPHPAVEAHGRTGLDGPDLPPPTTTPVAEHAVAFLAERILAAERPLTLAAVGPLTNVALLLALHPDAARQLERVVLMGGAIGEGNTTPAAEYNIWADPEAAQRVFESGLDVTMVGLEVTHAAVVRPDATEQLRAGGRRGRVVAELLDFYRRAHEGMAGVAVHDAVAIAHVIWPDLLDTVRCNIVVDCESTLCRGRTVVDHRHLTDRPANARAAVGVDAGRFERLLVERIVSLG